MQPCTNSVLLKLLAVLAGLLMMAGAWGQSVNPTQDEVRLRVGSFHLTGLSVDRTKVLDATEIHNRLRLERSRFGETMTVDEIHQVADALTLFLRSNGYVFHTVYLPPQEVKGDTVELRLREGVLTGVHVINQTGLSDKRLRKPFRKLTGKLLYGPEVEEVVQALKAQGGFRVFAFYSQGPKSGEAILNLRVDASKKRDFSLKADNYGSPASGKHRVTLQYSEYQLTGHHDRLSLAVLHAVDGVANTYGSIAYHLPFAGLNYAWDISASNNQFEIGDRFAALGLTGGASTLRTGLSAITHHHPSKHADWRLGVHEKRSNMEADATTVADEISQAASLQWNKTLRSKDSAAVMQSLLGYSYGQYEVNGLPAGDFNKLDFSLLLAKGLGQGRWRNVWQLNTRGQYSDVMLPSVENLGLTGAYGVRGFIPGLFNADSAVLAAVEWRLPNLLSKGSFQLEPFFFAEYAHGLKGAALGNQRNARFAGTGAGLSLSLGRHVSIQMVAAQAANGEIDEVKVEGDDQIHFEIRLR